MKRAIISAAVVLTTAFTAVGGAAAQTGDASVTVVHGVPGLTVDVYVDGQLALESFEPTTVTDPIALAPGTHEVAIRAAGDPADAEPAISGEVSLEAGQDASLVAHLGADGSPTLTAFGNDVSSIPAGEARLTVRHTAAAPAVDVLAGGQAIVSGLENPNEATTTVPAGSYSVAVAPAGTTDPVLGPADLTLEAGTAYRVYAIGSLDDDSLDLVVSSTSDLGGAPGGVGAGTSGLVDEGFPLWAAVLLGIAGAAALAAFGGLAVTRSRA